VTNVQGPERLGDQRYVTLVLRLLLDREGQLVQGEIGGPEGGQDAERSWVRFRGGEGLLEAVHVCVALQSRMQP
jgi:hypothetical protein